MAEREENLGREEQQNRNPGSIDNQQQQDVSRMGDETSGDGRNVSNEGRSEAGNGRSRSSNRGFAAMNPEKQKEIASEGGRAAHRQGVAHEWSSDEAREAGRKGGQIVSRNREHMSEIGRRGGQSSGGRRNQKSEGEER